jgi:hypothetical protein
MRWHHPRLQHCAVILNGRAIRVTEPGARPLIHGLNLKLQLLRLPDVVSINNRDVLSTRKFETGVSRLACSAISLANACDPGGVTLHYVERRVRGSIVHDHEIEVRVGLPENTLYRLCNVPRSIVCGSNHRDPR